MKTLVSTILAFSLSAASIAHGVVYTGAMDNRAGYPFVPGFTAQTRALVTGDDANGGLRLEWRVDNETVPGSWTYTYRVLRGTARNKGFALFDVETAGDLAAADILDRQVVSATDRNGVPIPSGLAGITISDPVDFTAVHDFSNPALTETSASTALNAGEFSHYSGDPGRVPPGVPGSPASATPSVGPVPHPFHGVRVKFPGSFLDLAYEVCEWEFRIVADRVPMWGKVFGWGDQTTLSPFWYANFYNDAVDSPDRLMLAPKSSLTGAGPYRGWVLVPGTLPAVTGTLPADTATGVPVTEPVTATFAGTMDPATITAENFTVTTSEGHGSSAVSGTVSYDGESKTATFRPDLPLAPNTNYRATVSAAVRDLAGNALAAPLVWGFTTGLTDVAPPAVIGTFPGNGSTYVATTTSFSAMFNEAIDETTLGGAGFTVAGVSGTIGYNAATRTATFTPTVPLGSNTTYTATVGTGVRDMAGNHLTSPVVWSVTTIPIETVLPFVVSTFPAARAVNVATTTPISATFSEAIDPTTLNPSTFSVPGIQGAINYDAATLTATITPALPLPFNTSLSLNVTSGVKDLAGNAVGLSKSFGFRTLSQAAPAFSVSGAVTLPGGTPASGVTLLVSPISQSGTSPQRVITDASGQFSAGQILNGTYIITPSKAGVVFSPRTITASVSSSSVTGINFTAALLSVTADRASPQSPGTPITFAASVQGLTEPLEYRFWLNSGSGYAIARDYDAANTFVWTPSEPGAYDILVDARSVGATVLREASVKLFFYQIQPEPVSAVTVTPGVASPQPSGTPITFTAAGQGGSGSYQYRFWLNSGSGFTIVRDYSPSATFVWTPAPGNYDILVDARNTGSPALREASVKLFFYQIQPHAATAVTMTPSLAGPQLPGTPITFTAAGQGGSGVYEYRFWLNSGSGFTIVQDYSPADTFVWTPAEQGNYDVLVDVRSAGSTAFREALTKLFFYQIQ